MASKRHLWSSDLALVTFLRLTDLIIGHFLSTSPIMPNSGSLCHPHGLEEAPVAHRPDPGQLQQIKKILCEDVFCDVLYHPTKFQL